MPAATSGPEEDRLSPCDGSDVGWATSPPALAAMAGFEEDRSFPCGRRDDGWTSSPLVLAVATSEVSVRPKGRSIENPCRDSLSGVIMVAAGVNLEASSPPALVATAGSEEDHFSSCGGRDDGWASSPPMLAATVTEAKGQPEDFMRLEERSMENPPCDSPPEVNMAAADVNLEDRLVPPEADGLQARTCDAMVEEQEAQFCAARVSLLLESVKFPEAQLPGSATGLCTSPEKALSYEATTSPTVVPGKSCALGSNMEEAQSSLGIPVGLAAVPRPPGDVNPSLPEIGVYSHRRPCPDSSTTTAQKAFIDKLSKNTEGLIPQPPAVLKRCSRAPPPHLCSL
uniref:Uncharacterized protein n=1 Tax=Setaria viridis TaxID=4556 RepID=A0A4U6V795_SETVI|nr:hypothetical protein SEVIR_4G255700v2 [Setaria viridis]